MHKTSAEIRQERASKIKEQKALLEQRTKENRNFTEDEVKRFNDLDAEIKQLKADADQRQREEEAEKRAAGLEGEEIGNQPKEPKKQVRYSLHRALRSQLQNGPALTGVELEVHEAIKRAAKAEGIDIAGVAIPLAALGEARADVQTVTEDGGDYGAAFVDTSVQGVVELLRPRPVIEQMGATYLTGLRGNVKFVVNEGGIVATWEGETEEVTNTKNKYTSKEMKPKRLSVTSGVSRQNLIQSSIDLEAYTAAEMRKAIEQKVDATAINGSGTGNIPKGILQEADVNVVAIATDGGPLTWENIVKMETEVETVNADPAKAGYLINAKTKGKLKTTKHEAGDLGYLMTTTNEINGYKVGVSNLVPGDLVKGSGTDLSAAIFGDFSELLIGQWAFVDVIADEITRKKEGVVEYTINLYMDIMVKQPKAFTVVKDIAV